MTENNPYKVGDVVTLKSNPERALVVTYISEQNCVVNWLNGNDEPFEASYPWQTVTKRIDNSLDVVI